MGHAHDHHQGDRSQYYLEQLFTIGVCAAFGGVTLILWYSGTLKNMLADKFHIWVFLGGAALLVMAAINAVALWFSVGDAKAVPVNGHGHAHDDDHHDHAHGNGHGHDHAHCDHHHHDHDHADGHCDHDHGHGHTHAHAHAHSHAHAREHTHAETAVQAAPAGGAVAPTGVHTQAAAVPAAAAPAPAHDHGHGHDGHSHGWAPWRYAVLLLPVAIYFVVPLEALSSTGGKAIDVDASRLAGGVQVAKDVSDISFQQLELASLYPENRAYYEKRTVRLVGQYVPKDARMFTLRRFKISCCAADAVPLNAVIVVDPNSKATLDESRLQGKWVQVTGVVQFLPRADGGVATALVLTPTDDRPLTPTKDNDDALVKEVAPPSNPYLN